MTQDPLLTPDEVAKELRISKKALFRKMHKGDIAYMDLGHRTKRIARSALDSYKARSVGGQSCN